MDIDQHLLLFTGDTGGIDSWLTAANSELILQRLAKMPGQPLSLSLFNQLLALSHQPPVSRGFFEYYWSSAPTHPYRVADLPGYDDTYTRYDRIESVDQLSWGLYRIYLDCLLYFGSIRNGALSRNSQNRSFGGHLSVWARRRVAGRVANRSFRVANSATVISLGGGDTAIKLQKQRRIAISH